MSWGRVKLNDILRVRDVRFKPDDKRIIGLKRVDKIDFSGKLHLSNSPSKTDMILVKKGDLLISGINVYKGAVVVYEGDEDIIATIHYSSYEFDKDKIDIDFLKLFLKSPEFLDTIKEQVPGGIKTEIKPKQFLPLEVLIPEKVEDQRDLVRSFSKIESKNTELTIELTHQLDLVKQLRQAFLREAMQGKLVNTPPASGGVSEVQGGSPTTPSAGHLPLSGEENASVLLLKIKAEKAQLIKEGKLKKEKELPPIKPEEIPFEIPKNWVWCRLGDITLYSEAGISFKALETIANRDEYGVIKTSAITSGEFIESENKKLPNQKGDYNDIQIHEGDLLICRASGSKGLAGKSCVVKFEPKTKLLLSDKSIRFVLTKFINVFYFQYFSRSMYAEEYFLGLGTKKSTTMNNITREQFYGMTVPLPPFSEQHRIVAKLEQLMRHCDELEQSIKLSQTQNEQLLQQVLREALSPKGKEYKIKDEMSLAAEE